MGSVAKGVNRLSGRSSCCLLLTSRTFNTRTTTNIEFTFLPATIYTNESTKLLLTASTNTKQRKGLPIHTQITQLTFGMHNSKVKKHGKASTMTSFMTTVLVNPST